MDYFLMIPSSNLEQLPDELLVHILRLLEAQDIFSFYIMTSKEMRKRVDIMFQLPSFEVKSRIILDENIFQFFNVKSVKMDLLEKRVQYSPHSWHTYRNDKLHSLNNEPAKVHSGYEAYYENGELHREDEPAIIGIVNGIIFQEWFLKGVWTRGNGLPDCEHISNGTHVHKSWHGVFDIEYRTLRSETMGNDGRISVYNHRFKSEPFNNDSFAKQVFFNEKGEIHCDDGPAIIYENGRRLWVQNGELFRPDRLPGVEDY